MQPRLFKIGYGYDSHRFLNAHEKQKLYNKEAIQSVTEYYAQNKKLIIGGIVLEDSQQQAFGPFKARSDGDVLYHAVVNALLSAIGDKQTRDIGQLFPNTDELNSNRNSQDFVQKAADLIMKSDYELIDLKIMFKGQLRIDWSKVEENLMQFFHFQVNLPEIHIQATSGEEMDAAGSGLGVEVYVVCFLQHTRLSQLLEFYNQNTQEN